MHNATVHKHREREQISIMRELKGKNEKEKACGIHIQMEGKFFLKEIID